MIRSKAELKIPRWVKNLGQLPEQITAEAMAEARDFLREEARRNASKGGVDGLRVRSGRLIRSLRTYLRATPDGGQELSLGMVFYGWVHDRGAVIKPVKADRLRFYLPSVGWRTAMQVVLPERRWARDALDATRKEIPRYLYRALERATRPA